MTNLHQLPTPGTAMAQFDIFRKTLPLPLSLARCGREGSISLDFGAIRDRDMVTGEPQFDWHLWVYMCEWDLYKGNKRILWRRESDNALAAAILSQLEGEELLCFEVDEADSCFVLSFSDGYRLHMDPDFYGFDAGDDMFMLFRHGWNGCLSFSPKRQFYPAA